MPHSTISVLALVSKSQQEHIDAAIKESSSKKLQVKFTSARELDASINREKPDFLVLEYEEEIGARIDLLTQKHPSVEIVVLLPKKNLDEANQILLAGARAFVSLPIKNDEFINSFIRLDELGERSQTKADSPKTPVTDSSKMIVIFSPRGGAGSSTVAVNLAISLFKTTQKRTLLVDGKSGFGHLDLMLNIKPDATITDLLPHADSLETRLIESVVKKHASGLFALLGPQTVEDGQAIQADQVYKIAQSIKNDFSYTLVDCGNQLDEKSVTWMDVCNKILLVLSPNLADLRDVRRFLVFMNSLNLSSDKFLLILNRVGLKGTLNEDEIENALGMKIFATIPHDEPRVVRAMNRGVPVYIDDPRAAISKALSNLAEKLDANLKTESVSDSSKLGRRDLLTTTSRLG